MIKGRALPLKIPINILRSFSAPIKVTLFELHDSNNLKLLKT